MAVTKASVKKRMESLGVYKPEFDTAIEQYVRLKKEYQKLYTAYEADGFPFEVETDKGVKKAPIVGVLEALRRDILAAENALGLTPAGLLKLQENAFKKQKNPKRDSLCDGWLVYMKRRYGNMSMKFSTARDPPALN